MHSAHRVVLKLYSIDYNIQM